MIKLEDIKFAKVIHKKISFERTEKEMPEQRKVEVGINISVKWGLWKIRKEKNGLIFKVVSELKSEALRASTESNLVIDFHRVVSDEEINSLDSQKTCIKEIAPYLTQLISEISAKMSISPIVFDRAFIEDLINKAKR